MRLGMRAVLAVAFLAMSFLGPTGIPVQAASPTNVHVSGAVTLPSGFTLQLTANASGTPSSLSGQGVDSTFHGNPGGPPPGTCIFNNLTGSVSGSVVTLTGSVTSSTNNALVGTSVKIIADASTGSIVFDFGAFVLTGTGIVLIR